MTVSTPSGSYPIVVGVEPIGTTLASLLDEHCPASRYAIVTDETVAPLYEAPVRRAAASVGPTESFVLPPGEATKSRTTWSNLTDELLARGFGRDSAILALGGGVIGDLTGFLAATYLRGIPYVQLPTTLLSMVDSSVGGKTGVNTERGKNLVGAFHQPRLVLCDVTTLATLPPLHLSAGAVEALKHGAIRDAGHFEEIVEGADAVRRGDADALARIVVRSVSIKSEVVSTDERETGVRAILNAGHTVAHAIEAASGFSILHGQAVAMGLVTEAIVGESLGLTATGTVGKLTDACQALGLTPQVPRAIRPSDVYPHMVHDKKSRRGSVRCVLLSAVGRVAVTSVGDFTHEVSEKVMKRSLEMNTISR